jgi:lysozyme
VKDTYVLSHLRTDLIRDEGYRRGVYKDSLGILTGGVGRNLSARGFLDSEINLMLVNDIEIVERDLDLNIPWWRELDPVRQRVLMNMCFNMGWLRLSGFTKFLHALMSKDYEEAADEMLDSKWAEQVGTRAVRLADQMRRGSPPLVETRQV